MGAAVEEMNRACVSVVTPLELLAAFLCALGVPVARSYPG